MSAATCVDEEDAEIVWEIDLHGRLSVEKIDDTGSTKIWLGPVQTILGTLADFLRLAANPVANGDAPK